MKLYVLIVTMCAVQLIVGAEYDIATYALLTNGLNRAINTGDWHCTTNEVGTVERIGFCIPVGRSFSDEIINSLCVICPNEWQEASVSSGNMHNPKMLPLRPYFNKAVFFTPTVQRFEMFVRERIGRETYITIGHEKLEYIGSSKTRMRKVNCILGVYIWRVTIGRSNDGGESNGEKSAVADKIISDLPSTIALIRITDDRYETRTILNGETCCVSVKDGIVECALSDKLYYGVKSGTTVQVISLPGNLKNKQHLVLAGNRRAAGESAFKDPFYVFADINYYGRNTIAIRNDGTLLLGSVITAEELMMDELSCGVNIEESDIIDAFRRRSLNGQLMKRGNK
jgi:hypothetical protein